MTFGTFSKAAIVRSPPPKLTFRENGAVPFSVADFAFYFFFVLFIGPATAAALITAYLVVEDRKPLARP